MSLTRIRYSQFNQYCHILIETNLGLKFKSLSLSNEQPIQNQLTLLKEQVWPLDEKIPNLECLTLYVNDSDELSLILSDIIYFRKLMELNITFVNNYCNKSNWEVCFNLIKNICSLEKFALENACLPLGSIDNWQNGSITHMKIRIKTTDDLIIILHQFLNLCFLDVSIEKFEALDKNQ